MRFVTLLLLVTFLVVYIRGDITIELYGNSGNTSGINNFILIGIDGGRQCIYLSEVFPDDTIIAGGFQDTSHNTQQQNKTNGDGIVNYHPQPSLSTTHVETAVIIIHNLGTNEICDQGRRHLRVVSSPPSLQNTAGNYRGNVRNGSPWSTTYSTTMSRFRLFELCLEGNGSSCSTKHQYDTLDRRKRSRSGTDKIETAEWMSISPPMTASLYSVPHHSNELISNVADARSLDRQRVGRTRTSEYVEYTNIYNSAVHIIDLNSKIEAVRSTDNSEVDLLRIHVEGEMITFLDRETVVTALTTTPTSEQRQPVPTSNDILSSSTTRQSAVERKLSTSDTPSSPLLHGIGTLELNTVQSTSITPPSLVAERTTTYGIGDSVVYNHEGTGNYDDGDGFQLNLDTLHLEDDNEPSAFVATKFDLFEDDPGVAATTYGIGYDASAAKPTNSEVDGAPTLNFPTTGTATTTAGVTTATTASGSFLPPTRCTVPANECCSDSDCTADGYGCIGRRCVATGNPRFTLTWYGDDDLDLYVETPDGTILSYANTFDEVSGGRVGEDTDQVGLDFHVENVYFPLTGSPAGTYSYYVRPLRTTYRSDVWMLSVGDGVSEVARHTGTGFSTTYFYYKGAVPTISPAPAVVPPPTGRPCMSPFDECCSDEACLFDGEICIHRTCIDDGSLRFTLTWIGDDDYDLYVETPGGTEISYRNLFDLDSGGRFGEEVDQFGSGYHVENVFFPFSGAPAGEYHFYVRSLWKRGDSIDEWQVSVVENGEEKAFERGAGVSTLFTYIKDGSPSRPTGPIRPAEPTPSPISSPNLPTRPRPPVGSAAPAVAPVIPPPTEDCSVFFDECCDVSDCRNSRDLCIQRTCITEGNPRFTLVWDGDDDLDLFVVTPTGTEISTDFVFDGMSGGRFDRDVDQSGLGMHIENIYFPILGTPSGEYAYGVRSSVRRGAGDDRWSIEVYDDGELIAEHTGSGQSTTFNYLRDEEFEGPQRPRPAPPRCSSFTDECCIESDCVADDEICLQRTCINDGSLRFTLQWIGDDDIDLYVETPGSTVIFFGNDFDVDSGGSFGEDSAQDSFGFHVENIYFPTSGAPTGAYTYFVLSSATRGVGADIWTITISENGEEVERNSGIGDSRDFTYFRIIDPTTAYPTPMIDTPPPVPSVPSDGGCTLSSSECCFDTDCASGDQICVQHHCISEGNPRITLSYQGNDDVNLYVKTPGGATLSFERLNDPVSGGAFEAGVEHGFGNQVESVFFPTSGGPLGTYTILVRLANQRGDADLWRLSIYENGVEVVNRIGTGDSTPFRYNRDQDSIPTATRLPSAPSPTMPSAPFPTIPVPTGPLPVPTPQRPVVLPPPTLRPCLDECCSDGDCHIDGELCVQRTCIADGSPRFTLTWTGNDDYR